MASIFSGKAGRRASIDAEKMISDTRNLVANNLTGANIAAKRALDSGRKDIQSGYGSAINSLQQYYPQTQGFYGSALHSYDAAGANADAGATMLSNSLGLNGAAGGDAALQAFRGANPGYEFQRQQAEDSVLRKANAGGMLTSGNMLTELSDRTQGLADSTYGNWQDRLAPYMAAQQNIAGARAGIYGQQADAAARMGAGVAGLQTGRADAYSGLRQQQGQNAMHTGDAMGAALLDLGSQQTAAHTSGMMAGQQAAQNRFGAIMGGLQLGGQLLGGVAGLGVQGGGTLGGNFLSGLFGK